MRNRCLFAFIAAISLSGATTTELGTAAYQHGDYETAFDRWIDGAVANDPVARYNLGVLWQQGLSRRTPANIDTAAQYFFLSAQAGFPPAMVALARLQIATGHIDLARGWLELAARWGNQDAVVLLGQTNTPAPSPDLAIAQLQAVDAQQRAQAGAIGQIVGCLIGGCAPAVPPSQRVQVQPFKCRQTGTSFGKALYRCE